MAIAASFGAEAVGRDFPGPRYTHPAGSVSRRALDARSDIVTKRRLAGYLVVPVLGGVLAVSPAGPASAHTAISISPARAGAKNAVATVNAEAESDSAGVTRLQVFLPDGIAPADITQVEVPRGWKLTKQDVSYTVEGPALAVGTNAEHQVRIRQLPMYAQISFKVLQTYSDGRIDRWISLPTKDDPEPQEPAPTVTLAGGSGTAPVATGTTAPPSAPAVPSTAASAEPPASAVAAPQVVPAGDTEEGTPAWWWFAGLLLIAALAVGAVFSVRRSRGPA